jgi:hypothetical protein
MTSVAASHCFVASAKLDPAREIVLQSPTEPSLANSSAREYAMAKRKMSIFERLHSGRMNREERKEWQQWLYAEDAGLEVVHPDAAGIDVGSASHFVAVPPDREERPVREFGSWTADLRRMSEWLKRCGIRTVAMRPRACIRWR